MVNGHDHHPIRGIIHDSAERGVSGAASDPRTSCTVIYGVTLAYVKDYVGLDHSLPHAIFHTV